MEGEKTKGKKKKKDLASHLANPKSPIFKTGASSSLVDSKRFCQFR